MVRRGHTLITPYKRERSCRDAEHLVPTMPHPNGLAHINPYLLISNF